MGFQLSSRLKPPRRVSEANTTFLEVTSDFNQTFLLKKVNQKSSFKSLQFDNKMFSKDEILSQML